MNILITSAGRRVSLVKAFQAELKALAPEGKVFTTDFNTDMSSACRVSDGAFQLPLVSDTNYLNLLIKVCVENQIKIIIPTIDTELLLLANSNKTLLKNGITAIVASSDFINICRDKRKMSAFFIENNIKVAKEYSKYDYKLPLFIKPFNGSRSVDTFIINKHEDLTEYHFKNDDLMFLEYIDHSEFDEYTCDLYYDVNHNLKSVVPRKRIEVRDGEVNKGITKKNILVDYIKEQLSHVDGAIGCLTAQFFKHATKDIIYGIEINARFGGGFPLSYAAGANYPKWIIQEYLFNEPIDFYDDWENNLLMLRYDNEVLVHGYNA
ncbi:carbamoyl phosphate synthase large subunit [Pseudalgibacter alginicilyticus]|uniref:Carbamoyl phosphate synthase large subunit n=1 Tax=Pseudalgibacter alginicilyticus TaxID=1736674 RepID=A0A0N7HY22_9FLAO|nr:ATP-grasp domain-containing protein [Pseudalgibacter alginicilyticus]ALJ04046.1 carbamoyl phosphate synthase large subunit [Pseudalgibacter alginicilyticus]